MNHRLSHTFLALTAGAALLHATNANEGFTRTTLAIGTAINKAAMTGDFKNSERTPTGAAETFVLEASKQTDANQTKEVQAYLAELTAGGHSNWHSHPGLEISINPATSTTLTFYILNKNGTCRKHILQPGQTLLVLPGEIHTVRNESPNPGSLLVERIHPDKAVPVTNSELQPLNATCPVL